MQRTDAKEGRACWPYPRAGGKTATGGRVACEPRVLSAAARRQLAGGRPGQKARFNKININCRAAARPLNIQAPVRPPKKPFIAPVLRPPLFASVDHGRWWSLSLLRGGDVFPFASRRLLVSELTTLGKIRFELRKRRERETTISPSIVIRMYIGI